MRIENTRGKKGETGATGHQKGRNRAQMDHQYNSQHTPTIAIEQPTWRPKEERGKTEKKCEPGATGHQRESNKSFQGGKGVEGEVHGSGDEGQVREEDG